MQTILELFDRFEVKRIKSDELDLSWGIEFNFVEYISIIF